MTIFLVTQNFTLLLVFMHSDATGIKLKELMNLSKMVQKALSYDPQVFGAKIGGCIPEKRISLQSNCFNKSHKLATFVFLFILAPLNS